MAEMPDEFLRKTWAGKIAVIPFEPLVDAEVSLFDADFAQLVDTIRYVDPAIADRMLAFKKDYAVAAGVFKKATGLVFGGLQPATGQFGISLIPPRPSTGVNTWAKSVTAGWQDLWTIAGESVAPNRRMYYYQGIGVYSGLAPTDIKHTINEFPYPVFPMEMQTRLPKPATVVKYVELPKLILVHTTGSAATRAVYEIAGTSEIAPVGLMFAEYDYVKTEGNFYA